MKKRILSCRQGWRHDEKIRDFTSQKKSRPPHGVRLLFLCLRLLVLVYKFLGLGVVEDGAVDADVVLVHPAVAALAQAAIHLSLE